MLYNVNGKELKEVIYKGTYDLIRRLFPLEVEKINEELQKIINDYYMNDKNLISSFVLEKVGQKQFFSLHMKKQLIVIEN